MGTGNFVTMYSNTYDECDTVWGFVNISWPAQRRTWWSLNTDWGKKRRKKKKEKKRKKKREARQ